jgi:hypothetical protein
VEWIGTSGPLLWAVVGQPRLGYHKSYHQDRNSGTQGYKALLPGGFVALSWRGKARNRDGTPAEIQRPLAVWQRISLKNTTWFVEGPRSGVLHGEVHTRVSADKASIYVVGRNISAIDWGGRCRDGLKQNDMPHSVSGNRVNARPPLCGAEHRTYRATARGNLE